MKFRQPILRMLPSYDEYDEEGRQVRVLYPEEYLELRKAAGKYENQLRLDLCLLTTARYSELLELQVNKQWFDGHSIHIVEHKVKRKQRGVRDRYIHLSDMGKQVVAAFLNNKDIRLSTYSAMRQNLHRWAKYVDIDTTSLSIHSLRATGESWLMFYYPEKTIPILQSTGHTERTALLHYLNLPFNDLDRVMMRPYLGGWE